MEFLKNKVQKFMSIKKLFALSLAIRVFLVVFGLLQDRFARVRYTDIDYLVYSQAATHVYERNSPFQSPTYRYTPLLAMLLTGNDAIHPIFGKIVFVACDLMVGLLIFRHHSLHMSEIDASKLTALWLLNPITLAISTRGNADVIVCFVVLLSLRSFVQDNLILSGFWLGLAIHFKIYPVIYLVSLALILIRARLFDTSTTLLKRFFFSMLSFLKILMAAMFMVAGLSFWMYHWYGDEYLDQSIFYHLRRSDTRHNFSPYFYILYLNPDTILPISLMCFIPQALATLLIACFVPPDVYLQAFCQTIAFVALNKVSTSQYFLWFMVIAPYLGNQNTKILSLEALSVFFVWLAGQGLWLWPAYLLEFEGINTFLWIWIASMLFLMIQSYVLVWVVRNHSTNQQYVALQ